MTTPDLHPLTPQHTPLTAPSTPITLERPTPDTLRDTEYLLHTAHGGFAMGSALATPRRRYHNLLNATATPPIDRVATADLAEHLATPDQRIPLAPTERPTPAARTALAPASTLDLRPALTVERFAASAHEARWTLAITLPGAPAPIRLTRALRVARAANAATVRYEIEPTAAHSLSLAITPLLLLRDPHHTADTIDPTGFSITHAERTLTASRRDDRNIARTLTLEWTDGEFTPDPQPHDARWLFFEADRGMHDRDTPLAAGLITLPLHADRPSVLEVRLALAPDEPDATLFHAEGPSAAAIRARTDAAVAARPALARLRTLADAADAYLAPRTVNGAHLKTVLAGYPWFADWGRDTMISLPGLMLATDRHDDALACLATFAAHTDRGTIPNRFDDYDATPEYNTLDASLWFLHAAAAYRDATANHDAYITQLLPAAKDIIQHYRQGTRFNIHADPRDQLITAGDPTTQLTWMDAKRNGEVFTPRHGKAVEINALWHRGLRATADAARDDEPDLAKELDALADTVAASFLAAFTDGPEGALHDCLHPLPDGSYRSTGELRINQIFAVSLPGSPLDTNTQQHTLATVAKRLWTPRGMRTLAPGSDRYQPHFAGDMTNRDRAYHNGTAWPWLTGHFAEAILRAHHFNNHARTLARAALQPVIDTLAHGCLAQIAEVFDAEPREPQRPETQTEGGCPAQAWSVAEALRLAAMIEEPAPTP